MPLIIAISIGELVEREEDLPPTVLRLLDPTAPLFPKDEQGRTNQRFPSEDAWLKFARTTGLTELFYGEGGLMRERPCVTPLQVHHLDRVRLARLDWEAAHPESLPGWGSVIGGVQRDHHLARLLWLEWWITRALARTRIPTFLYQ